MRYRAARTRNTLNPEGGHYSGSGSFYLRTDIRITIGHYLQTCDNVLRSFLVLCVLLCLLHVVRPTPTTLVLIYLPAWISLLLPLVGRFRLPGTFTCVVLFSALYLPCLFGCLDALVGRAFNAIALALTVILYLFLVVFPYGKPCGAVEAYQTFPRFGFLSLALAGAIVGVLGQAERSLVAFGLVVGTYGVAVCSGLLLVRVYAGWLACSPDLLFESAEALASISHCRLADLARQIPAVCLFMTFGLALGPVVIFIDATQSPESGVTHFFADTVRNLLGSESLSCGTWGVGFVLGLILWKQVICGIGVVLGAPLRLWLWNAVGIIRPLAVWEADSHPTPYAPGIYSASRFDVLGFPLRRLLSTAAIMPSLYAMVLLQDGGFGQSLMQFDESWLTCLMLDVAQVALVGGSATLLAIGIMFGPLLAYVEGVAKGTIQP